jgi:hypothetical protein
MRRCADASGPRGSLTSADLFSEGDDDPLGTAEVAEPEDVLVLCYLAEEFGAVAAQTGDGVVDVVDGEHDAMQAQRVGWRDLWLEVGRRRGVVLSQLELAVAVRGPHHRDVAVNAVESDGEVRPKAFDLPLAFQLHAELGEERDRRVQVVDDDGDVVHPLNAHVSERSERGVPITPSWSQWYCFGKLRCQSRFLVMTRCSCIGRCGFNSDRKTSPIVGHCCALNRYSDSRLGLFGFMAVAWRRRLVPTAQVHKLSILDPARVGLWLSRLRGSG